MKLPDGRNDSIILTNIGKNHQIFEHAEEGLEEAYEQPERIIRARHHQGADELTHRAFKDFGFQEMPFRWFSSNTALFYCMLIAFHLFEAYKHDILKDVIPVESYPSTVRRMVVDFAVKIVNSGGYLTLRVTRATMKLLNLTLLWERLNAMPVALSV